MDSFKLGAKQPTGSTNLGKFLDQMEDIRQESRVQTIAYHNTRAIDELGEQESCICERRRLLPGTSNVRS